jgi:hypothetical protein
VRFITLISNFVYYLSADDTWRCRKYSILLLNLICCSPSCPQREEIVAEIKLSCNAIRRRYVGSQTGLEPGASRLRWNVSSQADFGVQWLRLGHLNRCSWVGTLPLLRLITETNPVSEKLSLEKLKTMDGVQRIVWHETEGRNSGARGYVHF